MGIAIASGAPPAAGLLTAIVGGLVIGAIAGSPLQVSGPSAGLAVMVLEAIRSHGLSSLALIVAIMGVIQAASGLLKLGQVFRAVSPAVINGMLAGIGVLIFSSQIHVAVDDAPKGSGLENLMSIPGAVYKGLLPTGDSVHHHAAMIGLLTLGVLIGMEALKKTRLGKIPPALVAIGAATLATTVLDLQIQRVDLPSTFLDVLSPPNFAEIGTMLTPALLVTAVTMALVASAETLLCATAVAGMQEDGKTDYDRELFAQGIGNMVCGLVGGLPATGVITRSTANVQAGATTRASSIMLGLWLLIVMVVFPTAFAVIPRAGLAALLVYIGYKLFRGRPYAELHAHGRSEIVIFVVTVATIVGVNLLTGILVGLGLATLKLIVSGGKEFHRFSIERTDEESITHIRLKGSGSFLRLPRLASVLESIDPGREVHLHIEELDYIDHACLDLIDRWECGRIGTRAPVRVEWQTLKRRYHAKNKLDPTPREHSNTVIEEAQLLDFLSADRVLIAPEFSDRWDAIEQLGTLLAAKLGLPEGDLVETVKAREHEGSTCLGQGLMLPHGTLPEATAMGGVMAVSEEGWDFATFDGQRVHCIVLLATPPEEAARHLAVLAAFARLFSAEGDLSAHLLSAKTGAEAIAALNEGPAQAAINYRFESRPAGSSTAPSDH